MHDPSPFAGLLQRADQQAGDEAYAAARPVVHVHHRATTAADTAGTTGANAGTTGANAGTTGANAGTTSANAGVTGANTGHFAARFVDRFVFISNFSNSCLKFFYL